MAGELLRTDLDANSKRVVNLGSPLAPQSATYTDNASIPLPNGVASPGASLLASPADHVHAVASVDFNALLFTDPSSPTIVYTPTYSGGRVTVETWADVSAHVLKTITYTYASGLLATEVRKVFDSTATIVAQVTFSYVYAGGVLTSFTMTHDIGGAFVQSIDQLLESDPVSVGVSYSVTYSAGAVSFERWARTVGGTTYKRIDYVYTAGLLTGEIRKIFASDGSTVVGQLTVSYSYASGLLAGSTQTRDV